MLHQMRVEFKTFKAFILLIFLIQNSASESDDLYNTKTATTDLNWTTNPSQNGWEELSNRRLDGTAIRIYQVCNIDSRANSNWVRTPLILSKDAKRAYIDVEFSIRKCQDLKKDCKETFNLYYYETDFDDASSTFPPWKENPYVKIDTIAAGKRFDSSDVDTAEGVNHKTWTLGPLTRKGFYIAAQDQGACMSILSLRVYYFFCPAVFDGLAFFPRTVAGTEITSLQEVVGYCVSNASPRADEPRYYCNSDGAWTIRTGSCHCNSGYEAKKNLTECQACSQHHYKNSNGNHKCKKCPKNSVIIPKSLEDNRTSEFCVCSPGYFRSPEGSVHLPCSKPPSAPTKVQQSVNVTSVLLSWHPPKNAGERSDLYYNVTCETCYENWKDDSFTLVHCVPCPHDVIFIPTNHYQMLGTRCNIRNLKPYSKYRFQIYAVNGVTTANHLAPERQTVVVTTQEGIPSAVGLVQVLPGQHDSLLLFWSSPEYPNGRILNYEVSWIDQTSKIKGKARRSLESALPQTFTTNYTNATINGMPPDHLFSFRVRAATAAGYGPYSFPIEFRTKSRDFSGSIKTSIPSSILIGIVAGFFGFVILLIGVLFLCNKKRNSLLRKRMSNDNDSEETIALHSNGELIVQLPPQVSSNDQKIYIDYPDPYSAVQKFSCEIDPNHLKIENCIGQGEFGEVYRGTLYKSSGDAVDVAVKQMKDGSWDHFNFLREASTMAQFSHPNIIQLKGVVTKNAPYMIVTEYMENGSLDSFLKEKKNQLSLCQLVQMLEGIASGMRYLSSIKYIHRDLAARNILVDQNLICKVSDFGLSRTLEDDPHATYTTQGGKIAIRWTAPECIRCREFTSASDVWSFGIVMWEVTSYGEKPYWDMSNQNVMESINKGYRLPSPQGCPKSLHRLMVQCWAFEAKMRPTMDDAHRRLADLLRHPSTLSEISNKKSVLKDSLPSSNLV